MRTIICLFLSLLLTAQFSSANEFERYKSQESEAFKAHQEGPAKTRNKDEIERSGNPCDVNTGYGCKRTVRDDQLNEVMDEDDRNFSASSDSEDSSSTGSDSEDSDSATDRSDNPCDVNTGYGCKRTVRDDQLNEVMDEDDRNFSASSDSEDSSSPDSDTEGSDSATSRSDNPCDVNTGYGCKRTVRDDQLNEVMDEDDRNFSASSDSEDSSSSDSDSEGSDSATSRSDNPCDVNTGYGCKRTVRDDQLNEVMDEDDRNFSASSDSEDSSSSDSDSDTSESTTQRSGNPCDVNTGYGCKRTVRDDQLNEVMDDDDENFSVEDASSSESEDSTADRSALTQLQGRSYALIIGIDDYTDFKPLNTAVADAVAVSETLSSKYNFETRLLLNKEASRESILGALNEIRRSLTPQDNLLLYYAGHGQFIESTDASYWLPYNARKDDNTQWLESRAVTDHLKLISARSILVVADSCFSGTISRSAESTLAGADTRQRYLEKMKNRPSRVLISSGGNEPVKDGGGGGHSVFANAFLKAMNETSARVFTANELFTRGIREPVAGNAEQVPEYKVIRNSGHDGGDFVFYRTL